MLNCSAPSKAQPELGVVQSALHSLQSNYPTLPAPLLAELSPLADLVTRDSMIGTGFPKTPGAPS